MPRAQYDHPETFDDQAFAKRAGFERWENYPAVNGQMLPRKLKFLYNGTGGALTPGNVYQMIYDGDVGLNPAVQAVATQTIALPLCVAKDATPAASFGWFVTEGYCEALCDGNAVDCDKDDYLTGINAQAFFRQEAAATVRTAKTVAIYADPTAETDATPSTRLVYLLGYPVTV